MLSFLSKTSFDRSFKMVFARSVEQKMWPYRPILSKLTTVRRSPSDLIAHFLFIFDLFIGYMVHVVGSICYNKIVVSRPRSRSFITELQNVPQVCCQFVDNKSHTLFKLIVLPTVIHFVLLISYHLPNVFLCISHTPNKF